LLLVWNRSLRNSSAESASAISRTRIETSIITASFLLFLCALFWSSIIGPDYSHRRFAIIYANLAIALLVCLASAFGPRRFKIPLLTASAIMVIEWAYLAVVNSAI
jgi:cytochrome c oxidase assembly factor CtaG